MLQVCWSPKGGSGTTVVAAALAVQAAASGREVVLVDLDGDQTAVFGIGDGEGVGDWFAASDDVGPEALRSLEVEVTDRLRLLRRGHTPPSRWSGERMALAMALFDARADLVVVDGGRQTGDGLPATASSVVVTRACYLAVRRVADAVRRGARVVVVEEPGRALSRRDIEAVLGEVDVVLAWDPAVARAVDAGLLASRVPRSLRPLQTLVAGPAATRT